MPIMWFYLLMNVVTQYPFVGSVLSWQRDVHSNTVEGMFGFCLDFFYSELEMGDPFMKLLCSQERGYNGAGQVGHAGLHRLV